MHVKGWCRLLPFHVFAHYDEDEEEEMSVSGFCKTAVEVEVRVRAATRERDTEEEEKQHEQLTQRVEGAIAVFDKVQERQQLRVGKALEQLQVAMILLRDEQEVRQQQLLQL
eukprot:TRINITY_DN8178_c0_g1_i1.p3 TRINITY_DN8178_c0_g1~~TRINITY_DN8178_c0_g1_i1.p3  ORF type:complete len:112 (-),score=44.17 TRINITY_DN8178_c0_g1_i1:405-740(-)